MKRTLLIALAAFGFMSLNAQVTLPQVEAKGESDKENGWHKAGNFAVLFSQAAFNDEWTGGGTSNYAANFKLNYDFNYKYNKLTVDNRITADYGLTKNKGEEYTRKTSDLFELNSIVGTQIKESNWYYSFFLNFKTQFSDGYDYSRVDDVLVRTRKTDLFSPAYLQFGPGLLWKKSDNLKVNISPIAARLTFVKKDFTRVGNDPADIAEFNKTKYFGVEANKTNNFELGAAVNAYYKFDIVENITAENILALYTDYLEKPQNININYTLNVNMKINDYMSTNLTFQAIYEDTAVKAWQIREVLGVGFSYNL